MTNLELINRMKELLNEPNFYGSGGNQWSTWQNGKGWYVDCTCSIKAILWGGRFIPANRGKAHAGCNYGSNGVPDFTPASCVNWTGATRGNFKNLVPGEILLMTSHGHAGLYIGNGQVIEVTPAWTGGTPGCQVSQIGSNGERIKNGRQVYSWEYHGKIPVIDYVDQPTPTPTPTPGLKHKEGEVVDITGVYVSSTSTNKLKPAITRGTITYIIKDKSVPNPYLLDNGNIGWVNDDCIVSEQPKVYKTISNCYWLNLRVSPSYGNNIYTAVQRGTKVEYLGMESGWAKIRYDNKVLYCGSSYLS